MRKIYLMIIAFLYALSFEARNSAPFDFTKEYGEAIRLYSENKLDSSASKLQQIEKILASSKSPFFTKEYVVTVYALSDVYVKQSDLKKSEQIIDKAEKVLLKNGEQSSPYRRLFLMQEGQIHLMIEDINGGKNLLLRAKDIFELEGDNASIEYAMCLSGLALAYQKEGDYCFSNILLNYSVSIFKNAELAMGGNINGDSRYLTIWNSIALNFQYMGDIKSASNIRDEILRIEDALQSGGGYLALINSAYTEIQKGNYDTAIQMMERANESDYGYMYKDYVYQNLILSLYLSDNERVVDVLKHYIDYSKKNLFSVLLTYAESERENYWSQRSLILEMVTNAVSYKYKTPELLKEAYNITLYTKSLMMRFPRFLSDYAKENSSSEINKKYTFLSNLKKQIVTKGISTDSVAVFQKRINVLERELITSIDNYTEIFDDSKITCDNVRKHLKSTEVAIEFILLPEFYSGNDGVIYYGALIERSDYAHPAFVKLCEFNLLDDAMTKHDLIDNVFVDSLYSLYNEKLYNLIFHPLEKYLHDSETIYVSLVSGLHKLNLQAISINGQRIMDKYNLIEVSSTAQIIEYAERKRSEQISEAFLIGGVDYNAEIEGMPLESLNYSRYSSKSYLATRANNRGSWDVIPETLFEVQQIDSLLSGHQINTILFSGSKANEESFKNLDGKSPEIIHFATHGFFYEEKGDVSTHYFNNTNSYAPKRLPMQYSGLLLAGANKTWHGNLPPTSIEDGILTAEEISQMDLSRTKIVVLSACDTGLGKIDDVDGVYGLQRGFKMAGVETIVMSLWKISDDATKILMVEFYRNLVSGKRKRQSLIDAQKYLRKVENGKYDKPQYWASFVMLDGID